jgi:outer membrane protein TolC
MRSKKDLTVLKKLWIPFSWLALSIFAWGEMGLEDYLSDEKNLMFDFQQRQNDLKAHSLEKSWLSPVTLSYQKDWKPKADGKMHASESFSIGIDQPIFKSGGIYYGIKYARALRGANAKEIALQKRQLAAQAVELLFTYRKTKLQIAKLKLLAANSAIAIARQEEMFRAGLIDGSTLDQTILSHNRNRTQILDLQLALRKLKASFSFLSDKNPDKLRLPKLKLLTLKRYKSGNLKLAAERLHAQEKRYGHKMTWTRYLPTVTAYAHYRRTDEYTPGTMHGYKNYGIRVSMPLSLSAPEEIEAAELSYLLAMTQVRDQRRIVRAEYDLVRASLRILDRKIALAKADEKRYRRLLTSTENLVKAGEKTEQDVRTLRNSLKMKKLDRRIYYLEKQLQLLKLYAKVAR